MKLKYTEHFFYLILVLLFVFCSNDKNVVQKSISSELEVALIAAADKVFHATGAPGLIGLVSVEGKSDFIIKRGYGNLATKTPMQLDDAFRIGSVTKSFIGTALLMLVDEGKVDLNASIASYLPEYNVPFGDSITIRMLGNMTSGLYSYTDDQELLGIMFTGKETPSISPDSILKIAFRHPNNFTPGAKYEYSNTNTILLGLLLEEVTNMPASRVIKEKITDPLKLSNTYLSESHFVTEPYSHGYFISDGKWVDCTKWNHSYAYTSGGMISNLSDMKNWAPLLAKGTLLSESMKEERFNFESGDYGINVDRIKYKDDTWIGHNGGVPGYNTVVFYNQAKKITIVIYSNTMDHSPAMALRDAWIELLGN